MSKNVLYNALKRAGICTQCRREKAAEGVNRCQVCRERQREQDRIRNQKKEQAMREQIKQETASGNIIEASAVLRPFKGQAVTANMETIEQPGITPAELQTAINDAVSLVLACGTWTITVSAAMEVK